MFFKCLPRYSLHIDETPLCTPCWPAEHSLMSPLCSRLISGRPSLLKEKPQPLKVPPLGHENRKCTATVTISWCGLNNNRRCTPDLQKVRQACLSMPFPLIIRPPARFRVYGFWRTSNKYKLEWRTSNKYKLEPITQFRCLCLLHSSWISKRNHAVHHAFGVPWTCRASVSIT